MTCNTGGTFCRENYDDGFFGMKRCTEYLLASSCRLKKWQWRGAVCFSLPLKMPSAKLKPKSKVSVLFSNTAATAGGIKTL